MEKNIFITVAGFKNYFGNEVFSDKGKVVLRKEPDNTYDKEAIAVEVEGYGVCGYVANSPQTTLRGTKRASRIYDTFDSFCEAEVVYSGFDNVICALKLPFIGKTKHMLKGESVSVYLEKIEDDKYVFSILYNDDSETKVCLTIKNREKEIISNNISAKKDFGMMFSDKLKVECFFRERILVKFSLTGNIIAFAELFVAEENNIKNFFDIQI